MTYGLGYRRDPVDHGLPLWSSSSLVRQALRGPVARTVSTEKWISPSVLDQGPTGSCMGHGTAELLVTACAAAGRPLPWFPSPKGIYDVARLAERARKTPAGLELPALEDDGAFPVDAITGLRLIGLRPMGALVALEEGPEGATRNSDCNRSNVNDPPNLEELTTAAGHLIVGPHRIDYTSGSTVISACAASMGAAVPAPVGTGIIVDSAFQDWNPAKGPLDGAPDRFDPNGGGHWIQIVRIEMLANGKRVITLKNTWGAGWGDGGFIQVTEAWFVASYSDPTAFIAEAA